MLHAACCMLHAVLLLLLHAVLLLLLMLMRLRLRLRLLGTKVCRSSILGLRGQQDLVV